jgi:hypothetical protein
MSQNLPIKTLPVILVLTTIILSFFVLHQVREATLAQSGQGYGLSWWTVDGGGSTSNDSDRYTLGSTVGQHDAGALTGGDYTLVSGFRGGVTAEYNVYLPLVLREH